MKVLVLGGTGMAGHVISIYFKEMGHDVTVFSRREISYCKNIKGDITDFKNLKKIATKYDAIINAIGILNQDAENNKSIAVLLNSYLPHFLNDITKDMKTQIIHMSTDCVFSGRKGGYLECSFKDGESFYDRTKSLGEPDKALIFRNSIIGPDIKKDGIGLFNWFMKQEGEISGYAKAIWTGISTITLAKAIEKALEEKLSGVYHLVNNESINKYELLQLFNKYMKNSKLTILPNNTIKIDKSLINNRKDFSFEVPSYEQMVIEIKNWIEDHRELYPHYFKQGGMDG
jgi:dTDP-4-dehydrorhamnose reductase